MAELCRDGSIENRSDDRSTQTLSKISSEDVCAGYDTALTPCHRRLNSHQHRRRQKPKPGTKQNLIGKYCPHRPRIRQHHETCCGHDDYYRADECSIAKSDTEIQAP